MRRFLLLLDFPILSPIKKASTHCTDLKNYSGCLTIFLDGTNRVTMNALIAKIVMK